jgi:uncharacterized protein YhhL (DUF1145 family)
MKLPVLAHTRHKITDTLGSSAEHISVTILGALLCFLPIILGIPSQLEDTPLGAMLRGESGHLSKTGAAVAISLAVPLLFDTLLDYTLSYLKIRKDKASKRLETFDQPSFNNAERITFLSSIILPSIGLLLPPSTPKIALVFNCMHKAQIMLLFGSIASSMSRFSPQFFPAKVTSFYLLFFTFGSVLGSFVVNDPSTGPMSPLNLVRNICLYGFAGLFLLQSFVWLRHAVLNHFEKMRLTHAFAHDWRHSDLTLTFEIIHIVITIVHYISFAVLQGTVGTLANHTDRTYFFVLVPSILYEVILTVCSIQFAKHSTLQRLVRLEVYLDLTRTKS